MELGHFDIHQKQKNEMPNRENLNEKFDDMTKVGRLFPKIRALSSNFKKSVGETSPSPPSNYAPIVIRKYRIPLLTKFVIVKLKIDLYSVSMIFLKSALR